MTVNFSFPQVDHILTELGLQFIISRNNMEHVGKWGEEALKGPNATEAMRQSVEAVIHCIEGSEHLFRQFKYSHIDYAIQQLKHWDKDSDRTWYDLNMRSQALRSAIRTELKDHLFYRYPKEKAQNLLNWKEEWRNPVRSFPQIEIEVFSATDCYALGHNTASVFHSMRVAEHGLRGLAGERRIQLPRKKSIEWATWQEIIRALDDEIRIIGSKPPGNAKDTALQFYSGARADLNGFKDEYRNMVMHVRAQYDELQTLRALTNVHAFMERLCAKIDHAHRRIRWGF
jgi:hypothetical protein